jgi:hypothetical protein
MEKSTSTVTELKGLDRLVQTIEQQQLSEETTKVLDPDGSPKQVLEKAWKDRVHNLWERRYDSDTKIRRWLAKSTQILIYLWMVAVVVILMCNERCFKLPSDVLIAILGTTTATVLGLAYIVLKGFFSIMKQDVPLDDATR